MTTRPATPHRATRGCCLGRERCIDRASSPSARGPTAPRVGSMTVTAPRRSPALQGRRLAGGSAAVGGPWQRRTGVVDARASGGTPFPRGGRWGGPRAAARGGGRRAGGGGAVFPGGGAMGGGGPRRRGGPVASRVAPARDTKGPPPAAWRAPRSRQDPRPQAPVRRKRPPLALALALEVLGRDLVEELLEAVDDLLGVLDLVLELDRRLGDDVLGR